MEGKSETGTFGPSAADAGDKNSCRGAENGLESGQNINVGRKAEGEDALEELESMIGAGKEAN